MGGGLLFLLFRNDLQSDIIYFMRLALIASIFMTSLALNAQTIQGEVMRVADGDTITILDETRAKKIGLWNDPNPIPPCEFREKKSDGDKSP